MGLGVYYMGAVILSQTRQMAYVAQYCTSVVAAAAASPSILEEAAASIVYSVRTPMALPTRPLELRSPCCSALLNTGRAEAALTEQEPTLVMRTTSSAEATDLTATLPLHWDATGRKCYT